MLILGWLDGNSFVPVNYCLLSAADDKNLLCDAASFDGRSLAGKRCRQSRRKATHVVIDLVRTAQQAGLTAKYVLFDSCFSSHKMITALKLERKLDVIAMIKKSSKVKYGYQNEMLNIKEIYSKNRKHRGLSYDALTAHVSIVFVWYMMISVAQRRNEDDKTICGLFFCLLDELDDITFSQSMRIIDFQNT